MFVYARGVELRLKLVPLVRTCALGAALLAGGCASDQEYRGQAHGYSQQAYVANGQAAQQRRVEPELEDDGLPSQVAPPIQRRREADDPREPFSPNYGSPPSGPPAQRAEAPPVPVAALPQRIASY
jgi:hypothetical protein